MHSLDRQPDDHFRISIDIQQPMPIVWKYLIDVTKWPDWDTELKFAVIDGEFRTGATGQIVPKRGPKLKFTITKITEGKFYEFKTALPVGFLVIRRSIQGKNGFTTFTDEVQLTGKFKKMLGFFLGRGFKSVIPEVMQNIKNILEKTSQ